MTGRRCANASIKGVISAILLICFSGSGISGQQSHQFTPGTYSHSYSSKPAPVLRIKQGDTVQTTSVDAGGLDHTGTRVTGRGNTLTGPFYVEGALPGDVLAITLTNVSLNRNFATTLNSLIPDMLPKPKAMKSWRSARLLRWKLDLEKMLGSPADTLHLQNLFVPLHPFMGCVGVAPEGTKESSSGASGDYGG